MNYVYGIICHHVTNPLIFLVNELIKSTHSIILIHVDKKADLKLVKSSLPENSNIIFLEDRVDVQWGAYSQIEATLKLLKEAQNFEYSYFSLLSGDDIPLKSINEIESFISQDGKEYLGLDRVIDPLPRVLYKYPKFYFGRKRNFVVRSLKKITRILHSLGFFKQNLSECPTLYKGTNWFTLSREAVEYILEYLNLFPTYDLIFKSSFCGDEVYFHTIIYNSPFKNKLNIDYELTPPEMALRYIDWKSGPEYPRILKEIDFNKMQSSGMLFARKVDPEISLEILKKFF